MFSNDPLSVVEQVLKIDMTEKVKEIVDKATGDSNLSGETLWQTLVYSGVALGVEQSQTFFSIQVMAVVELLRTLVSSIDKQISLTDDMDSIETIVAVRDQLKLVLNERSRILTDMYVAQMEESYGSERHHIIGSTEPADLPDVEMEKVGFLSYRRNPTHFYIWHTLDEKGVLSTLECRCQGCMMSALHKLEVTDISESEILGAAAEKGVSLVMQQFGRFIVGVSREGLVDAIEGARPNHGPQSQKSAEDLVKKMMTGLRKG